MNRIDKHIDAILLRLDWNFISQCISSVNGLKDNNLESIIISEKEKLVKRLKFVEASKISELGCDYWTIKYNKTDEMVQLFFTPLFIISALGKKEKSNEEKQNMIQTEFNVLHDMLEKAMKNENYELCQIIKNRLEDVINEMP